MNPDTHPTRLRALALWLGIAVLTAGASAQTTPSTPAKDAPVADAEKAKEQENVKPAELSKSVKLDEYKVLGSRIRRTETEGPSPVSTYDREYIRATGAMTLADFLNYLPQTYNGIGAGRGSTPNELNPEFGQRTETTTPLFDFTMGSSAAPPGQTGVSGVSLRGLGAGSTLVLVDGRRAMQSGSGNRSTDTRQGFVDLNTIPLGMVDHVEVITDGASAVYGADAVAGVINIVLKKDWNGTELTGIYKGAFHGGGREREVTLVSGFSKGKLRGTVSVDYYDRSDLKASQRSFSKNQNHTGIIAAYTAAGAPIYGRDLRLNWDYPGVVQARTGNLNGITEAGGNQTRFAVINSGIVGTPTLNNFTAVGPSSLGSASTIRRGNTAEFLDIIPESERLGFAGNFTYTINPAVEIYGNAAYNNTKGKFETQPGVTTASASTGFGNFATIVPAAYNPFNQDILVGMVHYEFGSVWQKTETDAYSALLGARGKIGKTWEWDSAVRYQEQEFWQLTRSFNAAAITAALANPDASQRLNPFIDARAAGITQAAIYEKMAIYPRRDSSAEGWYWDFSANGDLFEIWGGPVRAAIGASYDKRENSETTVNYSVAVTPVATTSTAGGSEKSTALFGELAIPLVGKQNKIPGVTRLDVSLAGRYEDHGRAGDTTVPEYGFSWVPVQPILLRASFSEGYRPPALTEYEVPVSISTGNTLQDPKRNPPSTSGITVSRGSNQNATAETSKTSTYGIIIEPPFLKGLNFQVNYYLTVQKNVLQSLSAQTIVNNESLFPDRVTRAPQDATDVSLNQPGRITAVDVTTINFGEVRNESLDYLIDYNLPWQTYGRWQIGLGATQTLESTRQLAPGAPPVVDDGGTFAPPEWKFTASTFWHFKGWNASVFVSYIGGFDTNPAGNTLTAAYPVPSAYIVDVRGGYEFKNGVWRGYGKGLRVQGGIGNLFDKEPPFSDTVFGYNGGLHSAYALGRSYELSFVLPF